MNTFYLSLILILAAGIFQGTFGLGMKRYAPIAREIFWALFAIISMALIPWLWACLVIPDLWGAISLVPKADLITSVILGGCWGVGALMFGLSINYIGLSLSYGITMSLAAAMGPGQYPRDAGWGWIADLCRHPEGKGTKYIRNGHTWDQTW